MPGRRPLPVLTNMLWEDPGLLELQNLQTGRRDSLHHPTLEPQTEHQSLDQKDIRKLDGLEDRLEDGLGQHSG